MEGLSRDDSAPPGSNKKGGGIRVVPPDPQAARLVAGVS